MIWNGNPTEIVKSLCTRLGKTVINPVPSVSSNIMPDIPMPKTTKLITELDKNRFLDEAFKYIKQYFQTALQTLKSKDSNFDTELKEITSVKFICRIYFNGEKKNECKIWLGGYSSTSSIGYHSEINDISNDSSYNEMLSVECDDNTMGLKAMMAYCCNIPDKLFSKEQAAEYYWNKLIEYI